MKYLSSKPPPKNCVGSGIDIDGCPIARDKTLSQNILFASEMEYYSWMSTLLFATFVAVLRTGVSSHCTSNPRCDCIPTRNMTILANCSHLGITEVPKTGPDVVSLNLDHNCITFLMAPFSPTLVRLDLSYNRIQNFTDDVFANLTKLKTLSLEGNRLQLDENVYRPRIFRDLKALQVFNIKNNSIQVQNCRFPYGMWGFLYSLKTLKIDVISTVEFGPQFRSLTQLTELDISGLTGFCSIEVISDSYFENMPHLEIMNMSACKLKHFEAGALIMLRNLTIFDISNNERLTFASFPNISRDLQFSNIKVFKAIKIHCTFGIGTVLQIRDILHFQNTSLEEIYLDENRLALIERHALKYTPPTLKLVSIANNKLTIGPYVLDVIYLTGMEKLDLSFQLASNPMHEIFEAFYCENPIRSHENTEERFTIGHKNISLLWRVHVPRNLQTLIMRTSSIRIGLFGVNVNPENKLLHIDLSQNVMKSFNGPLRGFNVLKSLDLSECLCSYISKFFFDSLTQLEVLKLNNNLLGFSLRDDENGVTFKSLVNLKEMDLSDNRIQFLPDKIFKNLRNLQKLRLRSNYLTEWTVRISHIRNLSVIDLSVNQIKQNRMYISDYRHMECKLDNGTSFSFQDIESVLRILEVQCKDYQLVILSVSSAIVFFLTIIVTGLVYRYRWKLRYLFYMTKNKYRLSSPICQDTFTFDAFISHADEDSDFAIYESISQLEEERGLRLCLSKRDFLPGTEIAANITDAICKSRKTIIILSNHFLNSYWCMFEFNMARMESIYTRNGKNVLFMIMYRHVSAKTLPLSLLTLVESQSYIEYPHDPQGNIVFWDKIAETCSKSHSS
ncbi:toll-like receptor 4 [Saccostrea echinata]|uniref:toll-like receptor 4 n=1 Tax=Saccostrea echinata TaxID=191078 RepID=UPI002A840E49|nr:toll-like receptor 4 [Saccostrea echinata]